MACSKKSVSFAESAKPDRFLPANTLGIIIKLTKGIHHHGEWCIKTFFSRLDVDQQVEIIKVLRELNNRMKRAILEIGSSESDVSILISPTGQTAATVTLNFNKSLVELRGLLECLHKASIK